MSEKTAHIHKEAENWLSPVFDQAVRDEVSQLIQNDPQELEDRFYKSLEFGTGGMRGIMGVGTNRINKYTLGKNSQGLSNYLKKSYPDAALKVVIAYDCRHNSQSLAQTVAEVFSANGIQVYLFSELRTTPELSFAVRHLNCHIGIVLTASHNPPEYNGYKVYWTDGGQIVPPQDDEIIAEINSLDFGDINFSTRPELIQKIDAEVDEAFISASVENGNFNAPGKEDLHIVFTSLHGTSITAIPEVLKRAGYPQVTVIAEQAEPDGNFPTVKSPNPEEPEALELAIRKAEALGADMVIGTDPDSDRLGIAVRNTEGEMQLLNGNQTMVLMTEYLLDKRKERGFNGNEFIASTIVSTPMMRQMATVYGVEYKEALTGFKWIAKMIKDFPDSDFVGGGEESFGFMVGDFVRDKDAVTATLLACEIAAEKKAGGSSFYQALLEAFVKYGCYQEKLISLTKKGIQGAEEIRQMMIDLKENPLKTIDRSTVIRIDDYNTSTSTDPRNGTSTPIDIPKSNVLIYTTEDGARIAARPSGTEPKIKFYMSVNAPLASTSGYKGVKAALENKLDRITAELNVG
ncbi:MAG: phospho-sugar mutase [Flavobacteriaceae bacterium]|nr:phospho-sugar mutase [Flavobacteriaceae bacterium]